MHEGKTIEQLGAAVGKAMNCPAIEERTPCGSANRLFEEDRDEIESLRKINAGMRSVLNKCIPLLQAAQRIALLNEVLATIAKADGAQ